MLCCDICGETVASEPDMKTHLLIVHMENEITCPFCKLSGVNYDEICFHIETAHFEQNTVEGNFERTDTTQFGISDNKDNTLQSTGEVNSSDHSACASNPPKSSAQSLPKDVPLKQEAFYSENLTESRKMLKSREKQSGLSEIKGSTYEAVYSLPDCPFCGKVEACSDDMEIHMKTKHANVLEDQPLYDCPMCGLLCTNYSILQEHVNLHLEESTYRQGMDEVQCSSDLELAFQLQKQEDRKRKSEESRQEMEGFQKLQRQYGLDNSGGYKQQQLRQMEIEVNRGRMPPSEFHRVKAGMMESLALGIDDGQTKTSGIIEALHRYYQNIATDVRHVWLSAVVDHFHSSLGDKGWGCGYRNFQMLLSSLLQDDTFDDCLKGMSIPCIPKIQAMIEDAWKEGFDPQGASQLNNRLQGTKAWIGACEIYTLLTSLRVKCRIIDFHKPTGPLGTHPRLFEWILNYYSSEREGDSKVVCTSKPPIYLQHQGHSRTVVGIEERKNRTLCLLIFDPGCPSPEMQKLLKQDIEASSLKQLRKFVGNLKHKQYQIVAVEGALSPEEKIARRQASQVFTAEKIP
ncbi:PREDICTED: zinc finger with UFM1-specific peptidase domain protein isoform X1 [Dipodomys ordii]|uniref:Zinc finger-containing ubiquitin peptidase 1 n=1 Tax=Dipodomys ordii TaxID=10020 RepID=A0A1S3GHD4_DIPOR|nr:PREDICTED: zinc finger with UFM1-specific peptidase domain protein isoform X1 [Dipodomys ordii]XP_012888286.1 PREDICTED: zinc finger with UFM1-specific peptidase domain protein isoform X1 [Dipodomys ordii]XP_012888287.1 PREDICTED: zinc finger with UFM1-specific peptidase domain protein isoform X1 [Dipodomys ordii]XP_012888288.1 PREDICTED: zinc finger with UFM1-specific peptidase domain protein isoform X1 [Dipodomys ordii]